MTNLKRHLTVANVLSCMALFIALGGTAYAAVKLKPNQVKAVNIAKQAVTNAKLKSQAVTSGKIKNGGVVNADLGAGAVTGSKIAKEAVTGGALAKKAVTEAKLAPESVGTGKIDNEAITSAKISTATWKQLLKNVTYVTVTSGPQENAAKTMVALCPTGKEAIGGGFRVTGVNEDVVSNESAPEFNAAGARIGWSASARDLETKAGSWTLLAYAVCAEL
ncbi:MAG TPA: hypothetical protein VFN92_05225 [Solirubrobacterales bacterium]|nr:hypothetical protein [Solirubrobacterales bacterium]